VAIIHLSHRRRRERAFWAGSDCIRRSATFGFIVNRLGRWSFANAINDAGQSHAFHLTLIPIPSALALLAMGAAALLGYAWQKKRTRRQAVIRSRGVIAPKPAIRVPGALHVPLLESQILSRHPRWVHIPRRRGPILLADFHATAFRLQG
jgi:hypothetical protein